MDVDGSECSNAECQHRDKRIMKRYKCQKCRRPAHPFALDPACSIKAPDMEDGELECLEGHGCKTSSPMTKMTSLLLAATEQYQDDDGVATNATVAALGSWKSSNYGDYCSSLARLVVSNRTSTSPKAATYLAAAVHELWAKVDPLTRKNIKTLLMQALEMAQNDDDDAAVYHAVCVVTAAVAAFELTLDEWPALVALFKAISSTTTTLKTSRIMLLKCLQFSLEFIAQFGYQRQLPTSIEISMFTTMVHGCHAPNSNRMRYVAFNALYSALEFYQKSMEDKETRGAILKAIKLAIASPDIQLVSKALDCLANAAKYHFKLLRKHESDMLSWMCVILCSSAWPSLCKTRAIQVWNNAVTNGKDTNLLPDQFAMKAYTLVILELLQPHADDVDDVEENELSASAAHGLKVLSRVLQDDIVPLVVHALEEKLEMENWRLRGAAITAFSCILESVTTKVISLHIQRTLPTFLATLADPHTTLIHSTMSAVSNVCRYHIAALQEAQVHSILRFLINELKVRRGNTAIIAASAIASIAINCRINADDDTSLLSVDMDPLITQLMLATEQGGSDNLRTEAAVAIANLITSGAKDTIVILKELLQCIHIRVEILLTPSSYKILMPHYCVFVNAIFKRLPAADGSAEAKVIIDMLRMIIISVNFEEDCVMNAYQLISAVAAGLGNDFMGHIRDILPTILCSLAEKRVCAAAVELLFEIGTASGPFPSPVYEDIVDALMRMLSLFPVALDIEPKLIGCIGDFTRMMPGVSGNSAVASRECLTQVGVNNGNLVNDLRIAVLSAYKDIFSKIKKECKLSFFPEYVSHCACFLQSLQTSHSGKDNRVLAMAVDLISDVYDNVAQEDVLQSPANFDEFVDTFIDEAKDATDDETRLSAHRLSGILQAMTKKEFVPYQSEY